MRIGICDAQHSYQDYLIRLLRQINEIEHATVLSYSDPEWLVSDVTLRTEAYDIAIVNKDLGPHNGVSIGKEIIKANPDCQLIFVSEENRIVPDFYEVDHAGILPKSLVPTCLVTVIQRSIAKLEKLDSKYLMATSNNTKILIPCSEVLYMERIQRKTHIVLEAESVTTYQTPQSLLDNETAARFVQCHRSIYVNLRKITRFQSNEITLKNAMKLPVGRQYMLQVKAAFLQLSSELLCSPTVP